MNEATNKRMNEQVKKQKKIRNRSILDDDDDAKKEKNKYKLIKVQ